MQPVEPYERPKCNQYSSDEEEEFLIDFGLYKRHTVDNIKTERMIELRNIDIVKAKLKEEQQREMLGSYHPEIA